MRSLNKVLTNILINKANIKFWQICTSLRARCRRDNFPLMLFDQFNKLSKNYARVSA